MADIERNKMSQFITCVGNTLVTWNAKCLHWSYNCPFCFKILSYSKTWILKCVIIPCVCIYFTHQFQACDTYDCTTSWNTCQPHCFSNELFPNALTDCTSTLNSFHANPQIRLTTWLTTKIEKNHYTIISFFKSISTKMPYK